MTPNFWRSVDLKELDIPEDIILDYKSVTVEDGFKELNDDGKVFYRVAMSRRSSKGSILLLHGMAFSSKTWLELGTLQMLASMGYHALAIDLPGYGNSPPLKVPDRAAYLKQIIELFEINKPVVISPSMSGYFSLPLLLKEPDLFGGFVPVAPVGIEILEKLPSVTSHENTNHVHEPLKNFLHDPLPDLNNIKTPALIVFGEKDRTRSSALLSLLPNGQAQEIPNAGHPAYLNNPPLWHKLLYNFLHHLSGNI